MKTQSLTLLAATLAALVAACTGTEDSSHRAYASGDPASAVRPAAADDDDEQAIALDAVPPAVRAAALARLPGFVLVSAETETEHGRLVYSLEGTVAGERHEIELTADGQVLEVETGADDDDHDGDDDDHDDDDDEEDDD